MGDEVESPVSNFRPRLSSHARLSFEWGRGSGCGNYILEVELLRTHSGPPPGHLSVSPCYAPRKESDQEYTSELAQHALSDSLPEPSAADDPAIEFVMHEGQQADDGHDRPATPVRSNGSIRSRGGARDQRSPSGRQNAESINRDSSFLWQDSPLQGQAHPPPNVTVRGNRSVRAMSGLSDVSSIDGYENEQPVREWDGVSDWDDPRGQESEESTAARSNVGEVGAATNSTSMVRFSDLASDDRSPSRRVQKSKSRALDDGSAYGDNTSPNASGASTVSHRFSWASTMGLSGSPGVQDAVSEAYGGFSTRTTRRLSLHEQKYAYTPTGKLLRARANTLILRYSARISFYAPPKARASWGQHQHESHINWGDNFFDLVYVGIAYKLGNMLKNSIREGYFLTGLLYFVAIFMNAYNCWERKMAYDARFETTSIFHKFVDLLQFCGVAIAALHIVGQQDQSVANFWYPEDCGLESGQYEFGLCCGFFFDQIINIFRYVEVVHNLPSINRQGGANGKASHYLAEFGTLGVNLVLSVVGVVLTSIPCEEWQPKWEDAETNDYFSNISTYYSYTSSYYSYQPPDDDHGDDHGDDDTLRSIPMKNRLILGIWLAQHFVESWLWWLTRMCKAIEHLHLEVSTNKHKHKMVPVHIGFVTDRFGAWMMMMIGESVLSLLLVEDEGADTSSEFYYTFFAGFLIAQFIQSLHYSFEVFTSDGHAMRRKRRAGVSWMLLTTYYSMSIVLLGIGLKCILYFAHVDLDEDKQVPFREVYVALLCGAAAFQYTIQQITLPLHRGYSRYVKELYTKPAKRRYLPFLLFAKLATLGYTIRLGCSSSFKFVDLAGLLVLITIVQWGLQVCEELIEDLDKHHAERFSDEIGFQTRSAKAMTRIEESDDESTDRSASEMSRRSSADSESSSPWANIDSKEMAKSHQDLKKAGSLGDVPPGSFHVPRGVSFHAMPKSHPSTSTSGPGTPAAGRGETNGDGSSSLTTPNQNLTVAL